MAIRQYIGARYVPRFVGLFDLTQSYEALDVVDNGSGTSYIAKKPTPAGTPLTDTNYWLLYGSTNGAIVNLQQQINDMKDGTVPDSLQDQINNNTSDITALSNNLSLLTNRKYIFLGDSYGTTYTSGGNTITGWLDKIASVMGITSTDMAQSFAESGYGFTGNSGKKWINHINNCSADDDVTDVIFIGGTNDIAESNLDIDIANTIAATKVKFPNARIWIGFASIYTVTSASTDPLKTMQIYSEVGAKNGCLIMDKLTNCLFDSSFNLGNNHPNNYGTTALAGAISTILLGGGINGAIGAKTATWQSDANVNSTAMYGTLKYSVEDGLCYLYFSNSGRVEFTFSALNRRANGNSQIVLGYFPELPLGRGGTELGQINAMVTWATGKFRMQSMNLYFTGGYLCATLLDVTDVRNSYYNNDDADTFNDIQFMKCAFLVPVIKDGIS